MTSLPALIDLTRDPDHNPTADAAVGAAMAQADDLIAADVITLEGADALLAFVEWAADLGPQHLAALNKVRDYLWQ